MGGGQQADVNAFQDRLNNDAEFQHYCYRLWANFAPWDTFPVVGQRCAANMENVSAQQLEAELAEWRRQGLLPEPDPLRDDWVGFLWQSWLFQQLIGVFGFYPEADADFRDAVPPPVKSQLEFARRRVSYASEYDSGRIARGEGLYWRSVLHYQAPELYLLPFLPSDSSLRGVDVACGWGRIALALRNYDRLRVHACDLSQSSLDILTRWSQQVKLQTRVLPTRVSVFELPYAENSIDFLTAFDIFEHLTISSLTALLSELLRVARVGAPLYAEIPLLCFSPELSHLQHWTPQAINDTFREVVAHGKRWEVAHHDRRTPEHFTFMASPV